MMEKRSADRSLFEAHPRSFEGNRYVYPVLSRRAGGISIGVNLSPDKRCNFDCIYCQVDRAQSCPRSPIDLARLAEELDEMVELVTSGRIYQGAKFSETPRQLRRLNDFALSGDGEPTICDRFEDAVAVCVEARRRRALDDVKLVLITNASTLHTERIRRALATLDASGGEVWAKLDAGTEDYYRRVCRTSVPFQRILDNLGEAASVRPIVIQSLFMRISQQPTPPAELDAYCLRLDEITAGGGCIKLVQIHTVARMPAEARVSALADKEVDAVAEQVRRQTGLPVAAFYG